MNMKPTLIGVGIAAAIGAILMIAREPADPGTASEPAAAKIAERPDRPGRAAETIDRSARSPGGSERVADPASAKLSDRSASASRPSADDRFQALIEPEQREKLAEIRRELQQRRLNGEDVPEPTVSRPAAAERTREKLAELVAEHPDDWHDRSREILDEYHAVNHPDYFAGGRDGGSVTEGGSGLSETGEEPEMTLEAQIEEARRNREIYERSKTNLPIRRIRQERFR